MGVPLVLPHTSLTIPARSLHNLTCEIDSECFFVVWLDADTKYSAPAGGPKAAPVLLRAERSGVVSSALTTPSLGGGRYYSILKTYITRLLKGSRRHREGSMG